MTEIVTAQISSLPVGMIDPGPNDRKEFDREALEELAGSIRAHGLAQPPTVRPVGDRFEIIAGERRFRAVSELLGWSEIPVMVRPMDDETAAAIMLAENVQRADLDPLEEARAYQVRMDRFGYAPARVAELAAVPESRVRRRLSLLALEPSIARLVSRKQLPLTYAYAMTPLDVNRQVLAIKAYNAGAMSLETFRALCNRLYAEQQSESMFDPSSFMQVESYVADAVQSVADSTTVDEMDADPVGLKEIAERLGVKQATAAMWRHREILPAPRWEVSGMPVWQWTDIKEWAKATGRL